jgi:hypothetical protein
MSTTQLRVIGLLVATVVIFGSGVWFTRAGRPYGVALQTVHKLVALAGLFAVATFASGGVVSASETAPVWVLWLHRVAPWFGGVLAAASACFAIGRG